MRFFILRLAIMALILGAWSALAWLVRVAMAPPPTVSLLGQWFLAYVGAFYLLFVCSAVAAVYWFACDSIASAISKRRRRDK